MKNYKLEHDIQNEIRIWCGEHNLLSFRANVGSGYTKDGRWFSTGLPEGFPDLLVLTSDGRTIYVECKTKVGRARQAQKDLHEVLRKYNHVVLMPRSLDDFIQGISPYIKGE